MQTILIIGTGVGVYNESKSIIPPSHILITTDSTQYTIDTTNLYTIDNSNTTI